MKVKFYWHPYKYLPYEQILAAREISALLGQEPTYRDDGLDIEGSDTWQMYAQRATYFREVIADDGSRVIPLQTALEASTRKNRQMLLFDADISQEFPHADVLPAYYKADIYQPLNRQSTRYSAHGLHEYRGKFNPQIVRAIGNMLGLQPGAWILDPFSGSGTTLLESVHGGWNAVGVDINPLGIQIVRAKIAAMHVPLKDLQLSAETLSQKLIGRFRNIQFDQAFTETQMRLIGGDNWHSILPGFDYLCSWFTKSVLVQIAVILQEIAQIASHEIQLIFNVILSDILREVSLQDSSDLRIRRRKSPPENMSAIPLYLHELESKIDAILRARQYLPNVTTIQDAVLGDTRYCVDTLRANSIAYERLRFNAAITSPPYATALPYIDTQRLSLVLLGLIKPEEIRIVEKSLTGNREITTQERLKLEKAIDSNADHLPTECIQLCRKLGEAVDKGEDGFRRKNVPALLYQYFVDMALMFRNTWPLLQINAPFALVVGPNKTCLGGKTFVIDTPRLLTVLAGHNGFVLQEILELDAYQRFDVHQGNSIRSETLIILKKVDHAN